MAQKSNKPNREQNRIKIDMNLGHSTDRNLNVRWLRNRTIPVAAPQIPSLIRDLNSRVSRWSGFNLSNPLQRPKLQSQNHNSAEKLRPTHVTKSSKGI